MPIGAGTILGFDIGFPDHAGAICRISYRNKE